ncbi:hypothetical protein CAP35_04225 [Chitinophagaceae bacterium IBVUCB1]|nr:hypothetical protein CAP35_04225 [Chitinophagaceae bacterium IBVUCB1]
MPIPNNPLVSIIMPTYNRAAFILETIESIKAQTYTNWELLIMDDGSEDNTKEIVLAVKDERIQYHPCGRVGITGILKNKAINLSKGAFITFMDSDDLLANDKIEKQVLALQSNPQVGFCFTNCYDFNEQGKQRIYLAKQSGTDTGNFFTDICRGKMLVFIQTVMLRRECLNKTGNFNENRIFTDFSFIANLAHHYTAAVLYECLFFRRLHSGNNINANWQIDYDEYIDAISTYKMQGYLSKAEANDILFYGWVNYGNACAQQNQPAKARQNYIAAWRYKPLSIVPVKKLLKSYFVT